MRGKNTIYINGSYYDAVTGLPVAAPPAPQDPSPKIPRTQVISDFGVATTAQLPKNARQNVQRSAPVASTHVAPQRSQTLRREAVRRPVGVHESVVKRERRTPPVVAKSPTVSRFGTATATPALAPKPVTAARPAASTPVTVRHIHDTLAAKKAPTPILKKTPASAPASSQLKEHLIKEKLASIDTAKKPKAHKIRRRSSRTATVVAACVSLVLLGGYLTYLNMPNLSVRVAAVNAGIDAKFPEYRPDGYRFNGPIAYNTGEVTMKFQSNSGNEAYEITQKSSSWDSQAVLDNYVAKQSDSYLTYSEQGLTIYTFEGDAAWVNGGILYTIEGDAPLTSQQVLRIAGSM